MNHKTLVAAAISLALLGGASRTAQADQARSLDELRNTVINLLDALVQRGVMTREQAETMVAQAQQKAADDAQTREATEPGAVRVTYVPEVVQEKISERVREDIRPAVVQDVVAQAKTEGWGVPGALPDWIRGVELYGDVRVRAEGQLYADDNAEFVYLDFNEVNDSGGIGEAGTDALLNVSEDRHRWVGRVRLGLAARLGDSTTVDVRLTSGNRDTPTSANQTLGNYGSGWSVNLDRASIRWHPVNAGRDREFDLSFGRFANPFVSNSQIVWDNDLSFEGVGASYAMDWFGRDAGRMERGLFVTLGAFPLQEVELSSDDKWLLGAQLGTEFPIGEASKLRFAVAYYDYRNIAGQRNELDSTLLDFTAPGYLSKGNTLFDIRNDADAATNLFALAGDYRLANASLLLDLAAFGSTHVLVGAEYVKNIGWDAAEVFERTGLVADERVDGYDVTLSVGRPTLSESGHWRASIGYRHLERDAVLDAFTDSDFHLGGTDFKGYELGVEFRLMAASWLSLRYLSANEIDGPPLGIDVWQLDLNAQF